MQPITKTILFFSTLLLMVILVACGGESGGRADEVVTGGGADTPEQAVEEFLRAAYAGDITRAMSFVCTAQREPMRLIYNDMDAVYIALEAMEIDLSELIYEIVDEAEETARIAITGDIRIIQGEDERFINLDERFTSVALRKEDDLWRVC